MNALGYDLRYGFRALRKDLRFTIAAALTLTVGIGATTATFAVVNALLLRPFPYPDLQHLVQVYETSKVRPGRSAIAVGTFMDWQDHRGPFTSIAAYRSWNAALTRAGDVEALAGALVSPDFFTTLGASAARGQLTSDTGSDAQAGNRVVVSDTCWQRRFGGDPDLIGKSVTLDGRPYTVIAVMSRAFEFPLNTDVWSTMALREQDRRERAIRSLQVIGRLKPGLTIDAAQAEMNRVARLVEQGTPGGGESGAAITIARLREEAVGQFTPPLVLAVFGAACLVLLISCVNVFNLQLARASRRWTEVAVRVALGASAWRLRRQLLIECALLAGVSSVVALGLAYVGLRAMWVSVPQDIAAYIPGWSRLTIDARVFAAAAATTGLAALAGGMAPARPAAQFALNDYLKNAAHGVSGPGRRHRINSVLVIAETAIAVVVLVAAGLMVHGFRGLLGNLHDSYDARNLLTMRNRLPAAKYRTPQQIVTFYDTVLTTFAALPDASPAIVSSLPATGGRFTVPFTIEGHAAASEPLGADQESISASYFRVMRIPIVAGREFSDDDRAGAPGVAIVSRALADRFWPRESPLGHRVKVGGPAATASWLTIVGVARDVRHYVLDPEPRLVLYMPFRQLPRTTMDVALRTSADPVRLAPAVRGAMRAIDATQPIAQLKTMDDVIASHTSGMRLLIGLVVLFGVFAGLLACIGVFGVMNYSVTLRTRELGVRAALGAKPADLVGIIVRHCVALVGIGVAIGLLGSYGVFRLAASQMFGLTKLEPAVVGTVTLVLVVVALAAGYLPAIRAARVDPLLIIREQ